MKVSTITILAALTLSLFTTVLPVAAASDLQQVAKVGDPAPGFKLDALVGTTAGKEFKQISLDDYRGKWVLLFFYPMDFTFVCPTEIKGFNQALPEFEKLNTVVLGASTDSKYSHLAWVQRGDLGNLQFPLLSDIKKEVAEKYGALDEKEGVALRALFIVDPDGVLQYQVVHNLDVGRSVEETMRVLEALQTGSLCPLGWKPGQKTLGKP
ncbi:peroxiredoxin [Geomonas propionica]|uniref:Alkyl hydroperoxide reductase C n=1 Tax=Geomonas propionica TaxID=2798582 RepID=A0ABS0YRY0_9BACT|nr:peroxiredoxin [Geomonas propionica]MBJ6800726.1 peroxiredoxin [Geomonas propionica]